MAMNICFATDDKYAKPTAIAMMTVMLTNKDEEIYFYILSQSLLNENKRTLENTVKKYEEFNPHHEYDALKLKIEKRLLEK